MKLGGWTSLCFLLYWRRLELIIPAAITRVWEARRKEFAKNFNLPDDLDKLTTHLLIPLLLNISTPHFPLRMTPLGSSFDRRLSHALVG